MIRYVLTERYGVPRYCAGLEALVIAIFFILEDKTLLDQRTTILYPTVAKALGKDWKTAESDIRYAIHIANDKMDPAYRSDFSCSPHKCPSIGCFIFAVVATIEQMTKDSR